MDLPTARICAIFLVVFGYSSTGEVDMLIVEESELRMMNNYSLLYT